MMAANIVLNILPMLLLGILCDRVDGSRGYLSVLPGENRYYADPSFVSDRHMPLLRKLEDTVAFDVYMYDNVVFQENKTFNVHDVGQRGNMLQGYKVLFSNFDPRMNQFRNTLSFMFTIEQEYLTFRSQLTRIMNRIN